MQSKNELTGLRKRQQIDKTSKNIFLWVAGASVVVTTCVVVMQFLLSTAAFNSDIIGRKSRTNSTLESNIKTAGELKKNVDELVANSDLAKVKITSASGVNSNLQVVLDALPTAGDSATFANSLSKAIFPKSQVSIEALTAGVQGGVAPEVATVAAGTPQMLPFSANIRGSYDQIRAALVDIERVIRPIKVTKITIQGSDNNLNALIEGVTYYLPASSIALGSESVKPNEKN